MSLKTFLVANPVAETIARPAPQPVKVDSLDGGVVAFVNNGWPSMPGILARFREMFEQEYKVTRFIERYKADCGMPAERAWQEEFEREADVFIGGLGN